MAGEGEGGCDKPEEMNEENLKFIHASKETPFSQVARPCGLCKGGRGQPGRCLTQ